MKRTITIKKNSEFKYIFNKGKWHSSAHLSVYVMPNKSEKIFFGIAVGKKVAKSVKRNRIRRVIREAYRLNEEKIKKGNSILIVWKTKASIENARFDLIEPELIQCLNKAGILS